MWAAPYFFRPDDADKIVAMDYWLDSEVSPDYKAQPLAQDLARFAKAGEEFGEAMEAFLGYTTQNPRKGESDTQEHFLEEMADIALTAIYGIQHFTKDIHRTSGILEDRLQYHLDRMHKSNAEKRAHP